MVKILSKYQIAKQTYYYRVYSPEIAGKIKAGQYITYRNPVNFENIPLTISDIDPESGTFIFIIQETGNGISPIIQLSEGEEIPNINGPFGKPMEIKAYGTIVLIGDRFGMGTIYPLAKALRTKGNVIISIIGSSSWDSLFMQEPIRQISDFMITMTEDGSAGLKGTVTEALKDLLDEEGFIDRVIAIGPVTMMRNVAELARSYTIPSMIYLNPVFARGYYPDKECWIEFGPNSKFPTDINHSEIQQIIPIGIIRKEQSEREDQRLSNYEVCYLQKDLNEMKE